MVAEGGPGCHCVVVNRPDEERESAPKMIEALQLVESARLADDATPVGSATE